MVKKTVLSFIFILVFALSAALSVFATEMESTLYQIDNANVNSTSGIKSSSSGYKISDTIGQTAAGRFSSTGYIVRAGFQYINSIIPFRFSISDTSIDFSTLIPNTPATESIVLTVDFGSGGQYQITAAEEGKLRTLNDFENIADTVCDGPPSYSCDESTANLWTSSSSYGFGYNMDGDDIPTDFSSTSHYRPFADSTIPENPAVIMSSTDVGSNRQATMTMKANISAVQPAGTYQTIISFVATPSF